MKRCARVYCRILAYCRSFRKSRHHIDGNFAKNGDLNIPCGIVTNCRWCMNSKTKSKEEKIFKIISLGIGHNWQKDQGTVKLYQSVNFLSLWGHFKRPIPNNSTRGKNEKIILSFLYDPIPIYHYMSSLRILLHQCCCISKKPK